MRRSFFVPEVVQTSAMDCGPASLKALLDGHGISASYGRLREACQTDVDGTSIDTLEQAAVALGLDAAQVMAPAGHVIHNEARLLPALIVTRQPNGTTHFVIAWRRHGSWIQLMDPATGRRFVSIDQFLSELYVHTMEVPAIAWREWAASAPWREAMDARLRRLGLSRLTRNTLIEDALSDETWRGPALLDAAVRMMQSLVNCGGIGRGREASHLLDRLVQRELEVPDSYRTVRQTPENTTTVLVSGAVLITVAGRRSEVAAAATLSPELAAAVSAPPSRPLHDLLQLLRGHGQTSAAALPAITAVAGAGVVVEGLLLRGIVDLTRELGLSGQRLAAIAAVALFVLALLLIEWPLASMTARIGRKLEGRLRVAFLAKIPRLGDRYLQSRLTSDMAERSHAVHMVRRLPELAGAAMRAFAEMAFTVAGIAWLFPESVAPALALAAGAVAIPLAAQPSLAALDLRWRTHTGGLSRFYLDAMLGLIPVRAHGAERSLRREHDGLLREWARVGLAVQKTVVACEGLQSAAGLGLAAWLMLRHLATGGDPAALLLLAYWTLNLPVLGQEIGAAVWQYPGMRNITLRLLEPLGAPGEPAAEPSNGPRPKSGVAIEIGGVTVRAAGHTILDDIRLRIGPGEHVAVVGRSGAGKSSLVGLLLGWHSPAQGVVRVDGAILEGASLATLRSETAWVDPQVRLWNRSLLDNLRYGTPDDGFANVETALESAGLRGVLSKLPDGMQTNLGEGGALVSGGEGQRVRFGRALCRTGVRLAILDEPARGLDRHHRRALLDRARETWPGATMLCIVHDVGDTLDFPRVLVVEDARIVQDGAPRELAAHGASRYRAMLDAEDDVRRGLWSSGVWRRLRLEKGKLHEDQTQEAACLTR